MKALRPTADLSWCLVLSTTAVLFSMVSAFTFLGYVGLKLTIVGPLDRPGDKMGIPFVYLLIVSICCFICSILATTSALRFYAVASRLCVWDEAFLLRSSQRF
jgi:hypothetical protein